VIVNINRLNWHLFNHEMSRIIPQQMDNEKVFDDLMHKSLICDHFLISETNALKNQNTINVFDRIFAMRFYINYNDDGNVER